MYARARDWSRNADARVAVSTSCSSGPLCDANTFRLPEITNFAQRKKGGPEWAAKQEQCEIRR